MNPFSILLVDDDRLILATLSKGLEKAGYHVTCASDGAAALEFIQSEKPDLALLDIRMPGLNGHVVAEKFHELGIPFLALTAYSDQADIGLMVGNGALGYLVKPVDVPQLIPAIEAAIGRGRDIEFLKKDQRNLNTALSADRTTSKAIGILMERHRYTSEQAFQTLRQFARSQQRKVVDLSYEIVNAADKLNQISG